MLKTKNGIIADYEIRIDKVDCSIDYLSEFHYLSEFRYDLYYQNTWIARILSDPYHHLSIQCINPNFENNVSDEFFRNWLFTLVLCYVSNSPLKLSE